ncbi:VOC family protein [Actinoplanes rectilineatus]|uniref:VOC family protein n=1 Tax=Actinoplanes rectilineatus TaxID=113571 RepID=UPI000B176D7B|nr:VOC family protein [Actinoplanes rectilineatus]GLY03042.1 hypothetical protein Acsp01_34210 [Actinoplanes sp. NBRC 101535]
MTGFLDTPDRSVEGFWQAVTGTRLSARRGGGVFATLVPQVGDPCLRVQVVGDGPPRAHVDLHVEDVAGAVLPAGAREIFAGDGLRVVRSPAGIVFCLVGWDAEAVRPVPVRWPGGQSSVVDQLCLDVPDPVHDREVAFWGELTGWAWRSMGVPEFSVFAEAAMPLRLLVQRTGGTAAGVHVDFACDGVDAEVARHVDLGAAVVRRVPDDWTTLRDPAGREYCVTGRSPYFS